MREMADLIQRSTGEILRLWEEALDDEPWIHLQPPERTDHVPRMVDALAEAALVSPTDAGAHRAALEAAVAHGEHRRRHGFTEAMLLEEYHFLREALWRFIKRHEPDPGRRLETIARIDVATTMASRAGLSGYHRAALEKEGRWAGALDQLISESPFLDLRE